MQREELKQLNIPDSPGIYMFHGPKHELLYIGKAASLRDRVKSYFAADLVAGRGARIVGMVAIATSLKWTTTDSVLEALILEANLIKQHQPPYNVDEKDNKSFNYLIITREDFPRIHIIRGRDLFDPVKSKELKLKYVYGPFPQGGSLKEALKIVRRIFPYRDTCVPQSGKACFNRQIGLCPGVCSGEMSKAEYAETVRHISLMFSGNFQGLKRTLVKEMREAAKAEEFEKAAMLRRQVEALEHIRDVSLIKDEHRIAPGGGTRIEAYDVAHTGGDETVAVMTVVSGGEAVKSAYRKFIVRTAKNNDVAALREALSRRLVHHEWPLPRVFVVDGGKAQLNAARSVLKDAGVGIALVGVVKDERHQPKALIGDEKAIKGHQKDILLANAEAHRFAITWHRRRRSKRLV
jgi:excinuclease ABC subunit C